MAYFIIKPWYKKASSGGIYGAEWDGSSTTVWTRTDDAVGLANPNPYYAGMSGSPSSPFDNISPWKDMVISEDSNGGKVVAIPKFYFKLGYYSGTTGLKIQISMSEFEGSQVSPAHMDRGDGTGERDVVYIGRYHCASNYKSKAREVPLVNKTRADFRSSIHALGSTIWQSDYAMRLTIQLLYLVEFADWDSQSKIGYGCGSGASTGSMGYTDSMPYHTGTTQSNRTVYGLGTQYRNIEGLWDNVFDWCDGIRFSGSSIYVYKDPSTFNDTSGGTYLMQRPANGYVIAYRICPTSGYTWFMYPSNINSGLSGNDYICDWHANNTATGKVLFVGGSYGQNKYAGLFLNYGDQSETFKNAARGSRLMVLP